MRPRRRNLLLFKPSVATFEQHGQKKDISAIIVLVVGVSAAVAVVAAAADAASLQTPLL